MSPVEILRAAASRLREVAEKATPGPWRDSLMDGRNRYGALVSDTMPAGRPTGGGWDETEGYGGYLVGESITANDRTYLALVSPPLAITLADWLDRTADEKDTPRQFTPPPTWPPLVLANQIIGDAATEVPR